MTAQFSVFVPISQATGISLETLNQGTGFSKFASSLHRPGAR